MTDAPGRWRCCRSPAWDSTWARASRAPASSPRPRRSCWSPHSQARWDGLRSISARIPCRRHLLSRPRRRTRETRNRPFAQRAIRRPAVGAVSAARCGSTTGRQTFAWRQPASVPSRGSTSAGMIQNPRAAFLSPPLEGSPAASTAVAADGSVRAGRSRARHLSRGRARRRRSHADRTRGPRLRSRRSHRGVGSPAGGARSLGAGLPRGRFPVRGVGLRPGVDGRSTDLRSPRVAHGRVTPATGRRRPLSLRAPARRAPGARARQPRARTSNATSSRCRPRNHSPSSSAATSESPSTSWTRLPVPGIGRAEVFSHIRLRGDATFVMHGAWTDDEGTLLVDDIGRDVTFLVSAEGYARGQGELRSGSDSLEIRLQRLVGIRGRVTNARGEAQQGVAVHVVAASGRGPSAFFGCQATTDASGAVQHPRGAARQGHGLRARGRLHHGGQSTKWRRTATTHSCTPGRRGRRSTSTSR